MRQLLLDFFGGVQTAVDFESYQAVAPVQFAEPAIDSIVRSSRPVDPDPSPSPVAFDHLQANRHILLDDARVAYAFRRGRRRTIGFSVGADGLTVRAPAWTSIADVEVALRERSRWIVAKLRETRERETQRVAARIEWREGAHLPYLGGALELRLDVHQRHGRVGAALQADGSDEPTLWIALPPGATPAQWRDTAQAWLMRQARRVFTARLDHFAPRLGVRWQRLTLSSASTRWGSASADGSIRLNWRLIHLSETLIDYVVVHELAHLHEMNHSARFWGHVGTVLPDYADRRATLKNALTPPW